jgi:hypothetical protein
VAQVVRAAQVDVGEVGIHATAAEAEQLAAAQPGADLGDEVVAVKRPAGGKEAAELLRGEGAAALVAEDPLRVDTRLGAATSRTGLEAISRSVRAASMMRSRIERQAITPLWPSLPSRSCCQRSTIDGVIWRS